MFYDGEVECLLCGRNRVCSLFNLKREVLQNSDFLWLPFMMISAVDQFMELRAYGTYCSRFEVSVDLMNEESDLHRCDAE